MTSEIDVKSYDRNSQCVNCHLMPCTIEHNGTAAVEKYFEASIRKGEEDEGNLTCSFRGRPLNGHQVPLPKDYVAVNLVKKSTLEGDSIDKQLWKVDNSFDSFTYWNWDKDPSANDKIQQTLCWLDIANAIN